MEQGSPIANNWAGATFIHVGECNEGTSGDLWCGVTRRQGTAVALGTGKQRRWSNNGGQTLQWTGETAVAKAGKQVQRQLAKIKVKGSEGNGGYEINSSWIL